MITRSANEQNLRNECLGALGLAVLAQKFGESDAEVAWKKYLWSRYERLRSFTRVIDSRAMPEKITNEWLRPRLKYLNLSWLERAADLRARKLSDVIRNRCDLSADELRKIENALRSVDLARHEIDKITEIGPEGP